MMTGIGNAHMRITATPESPPPVAAARQTAGSDLFAEIHRGAVESVRLQ
jgi:hypothetical protein